MPNVTVTVPHQHSKAEARRRVEEVIAQIRQQYGGLLGRVDERWEGDTLHFTVAAMGAAISGRAFLEEHAVRFEVELPWPLALLAGPVKDTLEQQGQKLLGRH